MLNKEQNEKSSKKRISNKEQNEILNQIKKYYLS